LKIKGYLSFVVIQVYQFSVPNVRFWGVELASISWPF
jgi:hypothetical protein